MPEQVEIDFVPGPYIVHPKDPLNEKQIEMQTTYIKNALEKQLGSKMGEKRGNPKVSPRSHMLSCVKSHLDFNGEMNFSKLKNPNKEYEETANKRKMVKN